MPVFRLVSGDVLRRAAPRLRPLAFSAGETILKEGDLGHECLITVSGSVQVSSVDLLGNPVVITTVGPGSLLGQIALLKREPRIATVTALSDVSAFALDREILSSLTANSTAFAAQVRVEADQQLIDTWVRVASPFAHLDQLSMFQLVRALRPIHYGKGSMLFKQGDRGDSLFLIRSGRVALRRGSRRIAVLREGEYCGEVALFGGMRQITSAETLEPTELLALPKADFDAILQKYPPLARHFRTMVEIRIERTIGSTNVPLSPPAILRRLLRRPRAWVGFIATFFGFALLRGIWSWPALPQLFHLCWLAVGAGVLYRTIRALTWRPVDTAVDDALSKRLSALNPDLPPPVTENQEQEDEANPPDALNEVTACGTCGLLVRRGARFCPRCGSAFRMR